jgi:RNase adapter protein RapZ
MKLVILSGLSGSGKSVALHTLEDLGYYCIDNLPLFLLHDLVLGLGKAPLPAPFNHTAVGVDARTSSDQLRLLPELIRTAQELGVECRVIFLDTQTDALIRRFSETRRKHPLTRGDRALSEAIALERELLAPIRECADLRIDTTLTNVHELRDRVRGWLVGGASPKASILLQSFGFKHGVPQDVDFVFDVRCLPNPHWQPALKPLTGRDAPVIAFLETSAAVQQMCADLQTFFQRWIPSFETDGRSYLTIAIGCTGGQHRSVYMTETLRRSFEEDGHRVIVRHRELP